MHRQSHSSVRMTVRNRQTVNRQLQEGYALIISEMTKSASEEPGGVLRNRIQSNCVQPDDLRNSRQSNHNTLAHPTLHVPVMPLSAY
eukprot:1177003-Prorocentrum_minimum.AAC.1